MQTMSTKQTKGDSPDPYLMTPANRTSACPVTTHFHESPVSDVQSVTCPVQGASPLDRERSQIMKSSSSLIGTFIGPLLRPPVPIGPSRTMFRPSPILSRVRHRCILTVKLCRRCRASQTISSWKTLIRVSDLYMSVHQLISMTWTELLRSIKNLKFDKHCAEKLDCALGRLPEFLGFLNSQKMMTSLRCKLLLDEPDLDVLYGRPVSTSMSDATRDKVSHYISCLQEEGRHGSAYFVKLHHLRKYPHQFTLADRHLLETTAGDFAELIQRNYDASWHDHGAPEPFWTSFVRSPLFPHEYFLVLYTTKGKDSENKALTRSDVVAHDDRTDCLGRSISHLHHDYGPDEDWKICRHETKGIWSGWRMDADLQHQDILGRTALHYACGEGDLGLVEILLSAGADVSTPTVTGMGPMHFAACGGYTSICKLLWEKSASRELLHDQNALQTTAPPAPFVCAVLAGRHEITDFFCKQVLRPEHLSHLAPLLIMAVRKSRHSVVEVLLQFKNHYDITQMDNDGHDAMYYAQRLQKNRTEVMTLLNQAMSILANGNRRRENGHVRKDAPSRLDSLHSGLYLSTTKESSWDQDMLRVRELATDRQHEQGLDEFNDALIENRRRVQPSASPNLRGPDS